MSQTGGEIHNRLLQLEKAIEAILASKKKLGGDLDGIAISVINDKFEELNKAFHAQLHQQWVQVNNEWQLKREKGISSLSGWITELMGQDIERLDLVDLQEHLLKYELWE